MPAKNTRGVRGRKRTKPPRGIRLQANATAALARELKFAGFEQCALLEAKQHLEKAIRHLMIADAARRRRRVRYLRPESIHLLKVEQALADFPERALGHEMALDGAFAPIMKLTLLGRTLAVREIANGTREGAPLPSETVRGIFTRLMAEAGVAPTIIAQALGARRGSNRHDSALHGVARDLNSYEKALAQDVRFIRDHATDIDALTAPDDAVNLIGELPDSAVGLSQIDRSAPELVRRRWFERHVVPFSDERKRLKRSTRHPRSRSK
jgi:hypothetical protein